MANELEFIPVSRDELASALPALSGWTHNGESIERTFVHNSFLEAIAFVNRVAVVAEQFNHHPDFEINFKKVTLKLWTHKTNSITRADLTLAAEINKIA